MKKISKSSQNMKDFCLLFGDIFASPAVIGKYGISLFNFMCGGKDDETLNAL